MLCVKIISRLLFAAACCYFIPTGCSSAEIWRSGGMARSACEQWAEFNRTGVIPKPIKDVGTTKLCGWFSKGIEGDACADIRHFWLGCKIPNGTSRIVGGTKARPNKFPSFIQYGGWCGASILNEEWALTAAHCISSGSPGGNMIPAAGGSRIATAKEFYVHPQYDPSIVLNDIGLIKFSPKINYTVGVQPVRLPVENAFYTQGIGVSIGNGIGSNDTLNEIELPIITVERCREIFDGFDEKEDNVTITDDYICGQYPEGTVRNVCYGDSGSPYYFCEDNKLIQIGVTTFTGGCYSNYPVGYMRVSKYLTWIKETIAKNSKSSL